MLIATLGEGLELRLLELRHAPAYLELVSANFERLYWLTGRPTLEAAERRIRAGLQRLVEGEGVDGGIFENGRLIGFAGIFGIDPGLRSGEIGYWIDREHEGRGLVTRAVGAIVSYGFDELHLHRIGLRCNETNDRSRAVAERLGFRVEGRLLKADQVGEKWVDFLLYGLLEEEWQARRS